MNKVYIYTLSTKEDPYNIRYVGKTSGLLKTRLDRHISNYYLKENTYKSRWLKSIIKKGQTPIITEIDCVKESEWEYWEKFWIAQFKAWGFKLTNTTDGGDGSSGFNSDMSKKIGKKIFDNNTIKLKKEIKKYKIVEKNIYWYGSRNCSQCEDEVIFKSKTRYKLYSNIKRAEKENRTCVNCKIKNDKPMLRNLAPKKKVLMSSIDNKPIKYFESIREASRVTNIDRTLISNCCHKKQKQTFGFIFEFV